MRSATTIIEVDGRTVWRWLTVPALMNRWMAGVSDLRSVDDTPLHAGSRLLFNAGGRARSTTVTEFVPGRMLTLRSSQETFRASYRYRVIDGKDHCAVALDVFCAATGPARIVAPLVRALMWRRDRRRLADLEAAIQADLRGAGG